MAFAYKVIKNKNYEPETKVQEIRKETLNSIVSFIMVAKGVLGFRECAHIVKIATETNCTVRIVSGKKSGSSKSILSLVNLGIIPNKSLVLSIDGKHNEEAYHRIVKVINGETDSNNS